MLQLLSARKTVRLFHADLVSVCLVIFLLLTSCSNHTSSDITAIIPVNDEYLRLEQQIFDSNFNIQMGTQQRGGYSKSSYDFNFNLSDRDNIKYAYLKIITSQVNNPQNEIFLNDHSLGFLERREGITSAGDKKERKGANQAGTQWFLPGNYFKTGKNTLTITSQKLYSRKNWRTARYDAYAINKISLMIVRVSSHQEKEPAVIGNDTKRFPKQFRYLEGLTDEELYISLVKLPGLLAEIDDLGLGYDNSKSFVYSRIGDYYRWTGYYNRSLEYHLRAGTIQKPLPLSLTTLRIRAGLALAYNFVGEYQRSVIECEQALSDLEQIRQKWKKPVLRSVRNRAEHLESLVHAYKADSHFNLKQKKDAAYHAAYIINRFDDDWGHYNVRETSIGKYLPLALAYQTLGDIELEEQNYSKALKRYQQAETALGYEPRLEIHRDQLLSIYLGKAKTLLHLEQLQEAEKILQSVVDPTNDFLWRSHLLQGMIAEVQSDLDGAAEHYLNSIAEIEFSRTRLTSHGLKINFMTNKQEPYALLVDCFVRLGKEIEAFNIVEKSKARAFLDLISRSENILGVKNEALKELTEEERRLRETLISLQHQADIIQAGEGDRGSTAIQQKEIESARRQLNQFLHESIQNNKDFKSLRSAQTLVVDEVQELLGTGSVLIEYYYRNDRLYVWIIDSDDARLVIKSISNEELSKLVNGFRESIINMVDVRGIYQVELKTEGGNNNPPRFSRINDRLSEILIEGVFDNLESSKVYIVPHGSLHYLPFQAIITNGAYLIENHLISYLPSASVLSFMPEEGNLGLRDIFAMGNPDLGNKELELPYAEIEVENISKFFSKSTILTSGQASEASLKKEAGEYAIVHIASHGEFDSENPLLSCLRLKAGDGEDGRLETSEIFNLDLKASLVTLSACNTAMGTLTSGDELMGLNRAFLYAGTSTILGTLWGVNDRSTSIFMNKYYSNLTSMDKIKALQQTQKSMISDGEYSHPFYWAPFQIVGKHRRAETVLGQRAVTQRSEAPTN